MPASAFAMLSALMLAQSAAPGLPDVHKAACRVAIDGVCKVDAKVDIKPGAKAGDGGKGGNATVIYNFNFGGPVAGNGGNGGSIKASTSSGKTVDIPVTPSQTVSLLLSRCKLTVGGKVEVQAKDCKYEKSGQEFSLVAPSSNGNHTYTMKVALNEDKTGRGSLGGGRTNKIRDLGTLSRSGACWVNEDRSTEVCAWK